MTPQERELLEGLFSRVRAAVGAPRDPEADAFISDQIRQAPHAAYLLSQTVIVQEEALKAAAAKIEELNARIDDLETSQNQAQQQPSFLGGLGKSLFGGEDDARRSPRGSVPSAGAPRDYAQRDYSAPDTGARGPVGVDMPNAPAPGARWTQQGRPIGAGEQQQAGGGGSFLKGALGTAAGVAGGMMLANTLSGLLKESGNPLGIADAKTGQKPEAPATPASEQRQPWNADSREDTSSAQDDGLGEDDEDFDEDDHWDDDDDFDGGSEDI